MKSFEKRARIRRTALETVLDGRDVDPVLTEATEHYRSFVPEMAEVPRGALNGALLGTYELLAYGLALRSQGVPVDRIGRFYEDSYQALVARYPVFLLKIAFRLFRPFLVRRLRREALASQDSSVPESELAGPAAWEFDFIEPEPGHRGFGLDVRSCSVCSLFGKHGQSDLVPYVCALDDAMSEALGLGLRRTGTRAMGASCCDFRYEPGRKGHALRSIRTFPVVE